MISTKLTGSTGDIGLGDAAARLIHATGLDKLAQVYTHLTGRPCNCGARQEALNKAFPYKIKP